MNRDAEKRLADDTQAKAGMVPLEDDEVGQVAGGVSVAASRACPYCGQGFRSNSSYNQHLAECEERP